jgi:hypothetical protein
MSVPTRVILRTCAGCVAAIGLAACSTEPDTVPPEVHITSPVPNALAIYHNVLVAVDAADEEGVTKVELYMDGEEQDVDLSAPWEFAWHTTDLPDGDYRLEARAYDAAGNAGSDEVLVQLRDVVLITEIEVTGESEGTLANPTLEIEVYLYDEDNGGVVACSGAESGLRGVNESDTRYSVEGYFLSGSNYLLFEDVADRNISALVIEDDSGPCPPKSGPSLLDDFIGYSGPFPGGSIDSPQTLSFDNVVRLVMVAGRL